MNLQSIIATNFLAITALITLLVSSNLVRQRHLAVDRIFTAMILITASACTVEVLTFITDGLDGEFYHIFNLLGGTYLYLCNMVLSFIWCVYVDMRLFRRKHYIKKNIELIALPAVIGIILILLNIKFGYFFEIDSKNVYHRKPLAVALLAITLFYVFCSIYLRYAHFKSEGHARFFPIYMFLTPIIIGATVQTFWYGIAIDWCSVSLGLMGIHMSLQNELSYIDPLTKLFNRNYLNNVMADLKNRKIDACGIMIDLDKFKYINDTFGHSVGDEALIDTAELLRKAAHERASVIRFAGDEFIILLRGGNAIDISDMICALRRVTREFNASNTRPYRLEFSIGSALYDEDTTMDQFFKKMDDSMYREKKEKHALRSA